MSPREPQSIESLDERCAFLRAGDKERFARSLEAVARQGASLAMTSPSEALLEHYGKLLVACLRADPSLQVEVYFPGSVDALLERFNQSLDQMSLEEARAPGANGAPARVLVVTDARSVPPHEAQLLARLVNDFPGANVRAVLLLERTDEAAATQILQPYGRRLVRWDVALPDEEDSQALLARASRLGIEGEAMRLLQRVGASRRRLASQAAAAAAGAAGLAGATGASAAAGAGATGGAARAGADAPRQALGSQRAAPIEDDGLVDLPEWAGQLPAPVPKAKASTAKRVLTVGLLMVASAAIVALMHRDKLAPVASGGDGKGAASATVLASGATRERTPPLTGRVEPVKAEGEPKAEGAPKAEAEQKADAEPKPSVEATPPAAKAATPPPAPVPLFVTAPATPAPTSTATNTSTAANASPTAPARQPPAARPADARPADARLANARIADAAPGSWYVQMAARTSIEEADTFRRARPDRAGALVVRVQGGNPDFTYVVLAGPFPSREAAVEAQRRDGMPADAWVRTARALQGILRNEGEGR
jgi:hypothetical protein